MKLFGLTTATVSAVALAAATVAAFAQPAAAATGGAEPVCRDLRVPVTTSAGDPTVHTVFARLCGPGRLTAATPVQILLHGGTYDHRYWDWPYKPDIHSYVRHAARRGWATLNVDRLGYGRSDRPDPTSLDFPVAGWVTHQLVGHLRRGTFGAAARRVVLNGHSMGGIAARHAATHGSVDAVIISGLPANPGVGAGPLGDDLHPFHPAERDPKFAGRNLPPGYLTTKPGTRPDAFLQRGTHDWIVEPVEEILKDTLTIAELRTVRPGVGTMTATSVPTLVVLGRYDRIACRSGDCATDPTARGAVVVDNAGHSINMSHGARQFYDLTFSWLANLPTSR